MITTQNDFIYPLFIEAACLRCQYAGRSLTHFIHKAEKMKKKKKKKKCEEWSENSIH